MIITEARLLDTDERATLFADALALGGSDEG
jgi:hypothetical protein